ncbi:MAG TPA: hypothetical protein VG432_12175, partial [Gemmatimonadaceae bacterium]|nr:hypothetical protein [Gemmatimonadaceae bacterium]
MTAWKAGRRSAAALLIIGAASSCRVSDASAPQVACDGPLAGMTIQLSDNQPTTFSWAPRCTIGGMIVETNDATAPG